MQASFLNMRRVAWISIPAAALLISFFLYYAWRTDSAPAQTAAHTTESAIPTSERSATPEAAPPARRNSAPRETASELEIAVNGVMIAPASRAALISIGDQPARLFVEGDQILDGVVLSAVSPDRVVVDRGGELLQFQVRGATGGLAPVVPADAASDSTDPPEPTPPAGTEERRVYQGRD